MTILRRLGSVQVVFCVSLLLYVVLTVAVVRGSVLDDLDREVASATIGRGNAVLHRLMSDYVMLGQRGPSTEIASVWIAWLCLRRRSVEPALRVAVALVLLNVSVGAVKVAVGRLGPFVTPRAHDVLAGGNIYPSGHTANAVVLYGALASLALTHRRAAVAAAAWIAVSVGLAAIYLDYHWVTDVLGGWLAGVLVLCVFVPPATWLNRALTWSVRRGVGRITSPSRDQVQISRPERPCSRGRGVRRIR